MTEKELLEQILAEIRRITELLEPRGAPFDPVPGWYMNTTSLNTRSTPYEHSIRYGDTDDGERTKDQG